MKLNYLALLFINALLLLLLLFISIDTLATVLDDSVVGLELFKIIIFTVFSLIGLRILVVYFRWKGISSKSVKQKSAALLLFVICFVLYFNYSQKIIENRIVNRTLREQLAKKIHFVNGNESETETENLTFEEYQEIIKIKKWFPKVSKEARNISYSYWYDGFLPDHSFVLKYDVPKGITIKTFATVDGDFSESQKITVFSNFKRVEYSESEQ